MKLSSSFLCLLIVFFHIICVTDTFAQKSKNQLVKEKSLVQNQIKEAQQILSQTAKKKKASVGQLNAIKKQMEGHSKLINSYSREVKVINSQIEEDAIVITSLQEDLDRLKKEYAAMVYSMYKTSNGFNRLSFLFASSDLNQFYMRFKYLEQYASARKNQVQLIADIKSEIEAEKGALEEAKIVKSTLISQQLKEKEKLDKLKTEQNKVFASLKKEEGKLRKDIAKKKDDAKKLENLIAKLLNAEMAKSTASSRTTTATKTNIKNISTSFEKSKSHLTWPVTSGFISEKFGTHPHPVLKRVKMPNDGVNIQTKQNEKVRAVFDGLVKKIAIVPGEFKYVVIVQHGTYYTVYAKLKKVDVKTGQQLAIDDVIGEVNTDVDGVSEVQFQVWKNTQKLDPELWLARR